MLKYLFKVRPTIGPGLRGLSASPKKWAVPPAIEKLKPGEIADVIAWCESGNPFNRRTNISHIIQYSDDFAWGYSGAGPTDFALNILLHFTHGDEDFTRKKCIQFREDFIAPLKNAEPATIASQRILDWIEERRWEDAPLTDGTIH